MGRRRSLFSTRRRRSSSGDALVGLIIGGAITVAVFGVYLVAIAAVALVAWIARLVIQQARARAVAPQLVQASTPTAAAPPPESQFHVALPVDPAVFSDKRTIQKTAVQVFASWASTIPKTPKVPSDAIRSLELRTRLIGRLVTQVEGRRAVLRSAPYSGRDRVGAPEMDRASIDPWNPPADLRSGSRYVASCWGCGGDGRTSCVPCGGAGRLGCGACNGEGKYYGTAANGAQRLLNCKSCRGKGDIDCVDCTRGRVDCPTCHKTKKLECWLEIDTSTREDVQVEPDGEVTRAYPWGTDGVRATREEIVKDARVLCEVSTAGALTALPDTVPPTWLASYGQAIQPKFQPGEKVRAQSFALLEVPSIDVTYAVGTETQAIELHGLRMLAPPISSDRLFHRRGRALSRLAAALVAIPMVAGLAYLGRGSYFQSLPVVGVVLGAVAMAVCAYGSVWNATLGRPVARKWLVATVVPVAAAAILAIFAEPSARAARRYVDAGQLDLARTELSALGSPSSHAVAWADLKLQETKAESDADRAQERAAGIPNKLPQALAARAHVDQLLLRAASDDLAAQRLASARKRLENLSDTAKSSAASRAAFGELALAEGKQCLAARNWACALTGAKQAIAFGHVERGQVLQQSTVASLRTYADAALLKAEGTKDLAARVAAQKEAVAAWVAYAAVAPEVEPEPARVLEVRQAQERDLALLAKQTAATQSRVEAEGRRAAAQIEKEERKRLATEAREQRRQEAAERRAARHSGGLMCNDGTMSPSCSCGGSHRGCCSHHGGVAGCE